MEQVSCEQSLQTQPIKESIPDAEVLSCHKQHQCGFATSAGIPPEQALDQMKDEGHRLYPEHKHRKGHGLTTLPIQLQPQKEDQHT
jgi:succinate dehydrogenase/fumarate reductase-like Fe-S protein